MAISSKDLESLWQRYKAEAVPSGISVNQFFESNGVPYHVFEKWYKKKFQAPNVVECVVAGAPDSTSAVPTPSKQGNPYITITAKGFNTLSIYLCIRILKNQNYGNKGVLRKGDAGL